GRSVVGVVFFGADFGAFAGVVVVFVVLFALAVVGELAVVLVQVALEALGAVVVVVALVAHVTGTAGGEAEEGSEEDQVAVVHVGLLRGWVGSLHREVEGHVDVGGAGDGAEAIAGHRGGEVV